MSDLPNTDQALGWLTEQLGALSRLRNSGPRSHEFKQWRQATLTAAQRIWPGDPERSERFRRIPFSSGPRSTERSSREAFDHGCSEARRIIRLWIAEIKHHGIVRTGVEGPRLDPALEEARAKGRLKEMLGFEIPLAPASREAQVEEHSVPDARDAAAHKKRSRPRTAPVPEAVSPADALPLPALDHVVRLDQPAPSEPILVDRRPADLTLDSAQTAPAAAEPVPNLDSPRTTPGAAEPVPNLDDLLGLSIAEAIERVKVEEVSPPDSPTAETPVAGEPQPDAPPPSMSPLANPAPIVGSTPVALAHPARVVDPVLAAAAQGLGALAARPELQRLGVPAEDHERVAAVLTNLSPRLQAGELEWAILRETMAVVMNHPALARRAMPLLHSFFEAAA